jgi:hypothetical protein
MEQLESRDCPSTAPVLSVNWQDVGDGTMRASGWVIDDNPTNATVSFTGAVSGTILVDASGEFTYDFANVSSGSVVVEATDSDALSSDQLTYFLTNQAPTVSVTYVEWGANKSVTVWGSVNDEQPGGRTVTFSGAASGSVVTDQNGNFQVTMTATQLGALNAAVEDDSGQQFSGTVYNLTNSAPQILSFTARRGTGNTWIFSGTVSDDYSPGTKVILSGLPSLNNVEVTVTEAGTFSYTIELQSGECGEVRAVCKDWWDANSDIATFLI